MEKTYTFKGDYYDEKVPAKAEIKIGNPTLFTEPLYEENITIST